jgi:hypothetical protein
MLSIICKGKPKELNSNTISTKRCHGIKLQKAYYMLLQTSPNPSLLYLFNGNTLSYEENISIGFTSEEILTTHIVVMDHKKCKIKIVYIQF